MGLLIFLIWTVLCLSLFCTKYRIDSIWSFLFASVCNITSYIAHWPLDKLARDFPINFIYKCYFEIKKRTQSNIRIRLASVGSFVSASTPNGNKILWITRRLPLVWRRKLEETCLSPHESHGFIRVCEDFTNLTTLAGRDLGPVHKGR